MTSEEYREIVEREAQGLLLVGIDRAEARRFYSEVNIAQAAHQFGERLHPYKFAVRAALSMSGLLLLISFVLAIRALRWWALLAVPGSLALWMLHLARSSDGASRLNFSVLMIIAAIALFFFWPTEITTDLWLLLVAISLFLARFTYVVSATFLRALVLRNHSAFEFFESAVTLRERDPGA